MRPSFLIIASSWVIGMLPSCSSPQFTYPYVHLEGPLRDQITSEDIRQVTEIARQHPKIRKPVKSIAMWHPDELDVISGDDPYTYFSARKRNGQWTLNSSSIEQRRPIITQ
jgi:hypothetical protein